MRIAFILFFMLYGLHIGHAGQPDTKVKMNAQDTARTDSSTIDIRAFNAARLNQYKQDKAFNYEENLPATNRWQQFKQWFYQQIRKLFAHKGSATAFKWLFILIGVLALLFLIYKLSGMDVMHIFGKKNQAYSASDNHVEENIHIINFEQDIKQAIDAADFRLAVRLLYLQSLKTLTDREYIDWQPGKTNRTYLQELMEKPFKDRFANLTAQFEYIWYGSFPIKQKDFVLIQDDFASFNQQIIA